MGRFGSRLVGLGRDVAACLGVPAMIVLASWALSPPTPPPAVIPAGHAPGCPTGRDAAAWRAPGPSGARGASVP